MDIETFVIREYVAWNCAFGLYENNISTVASC